MGTVLIEGWIGGADAIPMLDQASVSLARERVRAEGAAAGLGAEAVGALASIVSELATNQLAHARGGVIAVRPLEDGRAGLEVVAADRGDGIADPAAALRGAPRTSGSLGVGLAAVCELATEVDIDVRYGEGTCVRARVLADPSARGRLVGVVGRPYPGEHISGDGAAVVRTRDALTFAVADGLGHGPLARDASIAALGALARQPNGTPEEILARAHGAVAGTRGAVMEVVRIEPSGAWTASGVGNVIGLVHGPTLSKRFTGSSSVLGAPGRARPIMHDAGQLGKWDVIALFTDGLTSRATLSDAREMLHEHPVVIAHHLLETFGRGNDDTLVAVVK